MNEVDEKTEQTAVVEDPNAEPKEAPAADSDTAQDDGLDDLLKEFDARREPADIPEEGIKAEPKATEQIDVNALAVLEQRLNAQEAREARRELDNVFSRFTDGVQADAIDAEAFLNAAALRDPRINQAYSQRAKNPKTWAKIETALQADFARRFGKKVDKQVTASRDAVASAVRSASTAAPQTDITDADVKHMSKEDFDEIQRKLGIMPV